MVGGSYVGRVASDTPTQTLAELSQVLVYTDVHNRMQYMYVYYHTSLHT